MPGLERCREPRAVRAFDNADLGEAAAKFGRRFYISGQGRHAFRELWIGRIERGAGPAHGRVLVGRRVKVVPKRGAECFLIPFSN